MSFRINTNVNAMNAMRNLGTTSSEFSKSITRLSTGLKINSAADDPAGLIQAKKLGSQIGGITQAITNSQDAVNYSKTAEGAFEEVNKLLNDARTLAVAASNGATQTASQIQANQSQMASIASSITRISTTTQFGSKKLLDGSSGVTSAVSDSTKVSSLNIGGSFAGAALTANATVTLGAVTAAVQASKTSTAMTALTAAVSSAGSFTVNGTTFNFTSAATADDVIKSVNQASSQTGVTASMGATGLTFTANEYGSTGKVNITDANGVLGALTSTAASDAHVTVSIGSATALFTGSLNGNGGLTLADADGNTLTLTASGGNTNTTAAAVGQVVVGSSTFQIGANAGQTASLSLGNYSASNLGTGAVSGLNMSNLDLTTAAGASNAISVIDKAIDDVSRARGQIGNFQRNVLESNIRTLGVAKENLSSSLSSIQDTDVAEEMTKYTKLQILQQAGMSVLGQANSAPQQVLNLLRG